MKFSVYTDKVRACWLGKNIGGTLGVPHEGHRGVFDLTYYTHDLTSGALPNDDLDLQLVWLMAAEAHGKHVNAEVLGEYWLTYVPCDWSEYGAGRNNLRRGFLPPVSGVLKNTYAESNGAWIRSEIWACLCPGDPALAVKYAFEDASVDHGGEGIYGELFCAAVQSAAFAEDDIPTLIQVGLAYIPEDCLLRRCVDLVTECYQSGLDWKETRKKLLLFAPSPFGLRYVYDNDLPDKNPEPDIPMGEVGNDAATNVALAVIGLLYGEGDFTKSLCIAANCGEDTDCTAGFIGALMGILRGCAGIEPRWIDPIGDKIKTVTVDRTKGGICGTVTELTTRVTRLMPTFCAERVVYTPGQEPEVVMPSSESFFKPVKLGLFEYADRRILLETERLFVRKRCPLFDASLLFDSVEITEGVPKALSLQIYNRHAQQHWVSLIWHLPEGIRVSTGVESDLCADQFTGKTSLTALDLTVLAESLPTGRAELLLELRVTGHPSRVYLPVTFLKA